VPPIVLCCAVMVVLAQPVRADQTNSTSETLIRLTVGPAPAPKPALRYLLLPDLREMNPGNPIQNYYKCFMEQQKFFFDKEAFRRREELLAMPLKELPARELHDYGRIALSQADWAARLDNPDWQILQKLKDDGIHVRVPDLADLRKLAPALKVRFRAEVALGRIDDAIRTAKTMFALARHLGEHPTPMGTLVGISYANSAFGPLEEMLEQPGCPNLYWALTSLPTPLVPVDKGMEGERVAFTREFRELDSTAPMSADQLTRFIAHIEGRILGEPWNAMKVRAWLDARTKDEAMFRDARRRLVEHGLAEERLLRFPPEQVILLDEKREYDVRFDDLLKTMNLPAWQAEAVTGPARPGREWLFADALVGPSTYRVHHMRWRLDQRIALLRHVEALRLYAAEHDGRLPAKLSEIAVPLPEDPFTGKPFRYELIGNTAHLRGTPPRGAGNDATFRVHYEVTLQK
jgi:hypothetical protein